MGDDGVYVVTWTDNSAGGIIGQRYGSDGALIGVPFGINDSTVGNQDLSSVSAGPFGSFVVSWLDLGQGGERVMFERFTTDNPSVGIKAAGPQTPLQDLLPIWVDGSDSLFVGSGLSTRILVADEIRQPLFAVDTDNGQIHQLDPDTTAIVAIDSAARTNQ